MCNDMVYSEDTFEAVQGINTGQPDDLDFVPVAPLILKNGRVCIALSFVVALCAR
jgi:hypothetical protein